jgi:hypothetical protein
MMEKKSSHILNASSNLLGFSLVIITSLKISKISHSTHLDEFAGVACFLPSVAFFFSAIRSKHERRSFRFETIADYLFLIALFCIVLAVIIVTVKII